MIPLLSIVFTVAFILYLGISAFAAKAVTVPRRRGVAAQNGGWSYEADPRTHAGLEFDDVSFGARGDRTLISAWYIPHPAARQVVIFVHGKDKSRTHEYQGGTLSFLRAMHDRGFTMLMIDMRGHGSSAAGHTTFGLHERRDVLGAVDWLIEQGFEPGSIGVLGTSMGGAAVIAAAAEEPAIGAVVSDSSYAAIYPVMRSVLHRRARALRLFLPSSLLMTRLRTGASIWRARPVDEIRRIAPRPVLIIHGTRDWLIPFSHAEALHAAAPGSELWLVPDAGHVRIYAYDPHAYVERVAAFFARSLGPTAPAAPLDRAADLNCAA